MGFEHLTSAEKVILGLRTAIMSGTLPVGEQIRQEKVAAEYSVSRMPVREAFRQLEAEGLLVVYPGRGTFVNRLSAEEIHEICDIRILLECDAMRRAVPLLTPIVLQEADLLVSKMALETDSWAFGELDVAFHRLLYTPIKRNHQLDLIKTLRNKVTRYLYAAVPIEKYRDGAVREHRDILAACRAGDVTAAVAAVETHLRNTAEQYTP